jgi:hypothetical protein
MRTGWLRLYHLKILQAQFPYWVFVLVVGGSVLINHKPQKNHINQLDRVLLGLRVLMVLTDWII